MLSAGEAAPGLWCSEDALDCVLDAVGLMVGGRIEYFLPARADAGRGKFAMV